MYENGGKAMIVESYFHHHSQEIINSILPIKNQLISTLEKIKAPIPLKERKVEGKTPRIGFKAPDFTLPIISKIQKSGWYADVEFIQGVFIPHGSALNAFCLVKFDKDYNFSRAI